MPQGNDHTPQETNRKEPHSLQDRVCNALAFVALIAIVLVGGSSILSDVLPKETAHQEPVPDATPIDSPEEEMPSSFDEMPSSSFSDASKEDVVADTLSVELSDTTAVAEPKVSADTTVHAIPAEPVHHVHEQPADSL